ncbi:HlyD family secretion protein [Candidatus Coxiella mudrowiae]|nr:HlyD family secretion protein [Candidatus Coxiella mudrowiae]
MSVGSLAGINGVNVSSEVSGTIIGIDFESGKLVKRGQSLI